MDDDVGAPQLLRDGGIPHVQDVPLRRRALTAPLVDGDDLLDLVGRDEPLGEQRADAGRGTGDRDDGPAHAGAREGLTGFALREPADLGNSPGVSSGCLQYERE